MSLSRERQGIEQDHLPFLSFLLGSSVASRERQGIEQGHLPFLSFLLGSSVASRERQGIEQGHLPFLSFLSSRPVSFNVKDKELSMAIFPFSPFSLRFQRRFT